MSQAYWIVIACGVLALVYGFYAYGRVMAASTGNARMYSPLTAFNFFSHGTQDLYPTFLQVQHGFSPATVGAIAEVGAKPVFIDCDDTFGMNLDLLEGAITPRTKAIMPVQLTGNVIDMPRVNAIAAKHGLKVVEDACQSLYGEWQGRRAGSFGIAAGFSMHPLKIINVWGDAGVIVTDDAAVAELAGLKVVMVPGSEEASGMRLSRPHGLKSTVKLEAKFPWLCDSSYHS